MNNTPKNLSHLCTLGAMLALAAVLPACRGDREDAPPRQFFPDMDDAPKWRSQAKSEFFVDGRTMRKPVPGTVPFSKAPISASTLADKPAWAAPFLQDRADLAKFDLAYYEGKNADQTYVERIPASVTVDKALLLRGHERFDIYCAVCHGRMGDGKGMVGQQWSYGLPTFHDPKYSDPKQDFGKDGYIFHVARYGVPGATLDAVTKMPSYAHALNTHDTWAVVAYIRALQETQRGVASDVPTAQREQLEAKRGSKPKPAAPPAPADAAPKAGGKS